MYLNKSRRENLVKEGYCFVPELKFNLAAKEAIESKKKIYSENSNLHEKYLVSFNFDGFLNELEDIAIELGYKKENVKKNDVYRILRVCDQTHESEAYRGHFDSHIFTLVTPVNIPDTGKEDSGQLIIFPKVRKEPIQEFSNIIGKARFKLFNSKNGIKKLSEKQKPIVLDFSNNVPLLFLGRVTYHCNRPFKMKNNEKRVTMLTHFFDPSPSFGLGKVLRLLRNR
ncbi:hypothetical protein M9B39_04145 [SAR86 cluster bacterium]|nr:hypothetical protein M9B39_04145 [SAR86 cluster bacterium]